MAMAKVLIIIEVTDALLCRCKCRRGYTGRYCERAPTCRKRKSRKFVEENGCRCRCRYGDKLYK